MKTVSEQASSLLSLLGDTPDELADFFRRNGFKGVVGDPLLCPCGHFLKNTFKNEDDIFVYRKFTYTNHSPATQNSNQVADFIENFDNGAYPDLVVTKNQFHQIYG